MCAKQAIPSRRNHADKSQQAGKAMARKDKAAAVPTVTAPSLCRPIRAGPLSLEGHLSNLQRQLHQCCRQEPRGSKGSAILLRASKGSAPRPRWTNANRQLCGPSAGSSASAVPAAMGAGQALPTGPLFLLLGS